MRKRVSTLQYLVTACHPPQHLFHFIPCGVSTLAEAFTTYPLG